MSRELSSCRHDWLPHVRHGASAPHLYVCAKCAAIVEPTLCEGYDEPDDRCPHHPDDCICWRHRKMNDAFKDSRHKSSADHWRGWHTIIGEDGSPYMTRIWLGRLRLHIFHRGDLDQDPHDHPWDFWTFPLTPYVEEVTEKRDVRVSDHVVKAVGETFDFGHMETEYRTERHVVPAWRWAFRPAEHTHRVLGRYSGNVNRRHDDNIIMGVPADYANATSGIEPYYDDRKIVTLVWRSGFKRKWGFLKNRDGKWCWIAWRDYVYGGGRGAPCE